MISQLASPAVCVVEDEEADYQPILSALNSLYVSSVHLRGTMDSLPTAPFKHLQLIFLDLHLSGTIGKDAASYTANAFRRIVSVTTAPIIVVIWSKYAQEKIDVAGLPGDQETEADLFKRTLLDAEPGYKGRLIFVEMDKPKQDGRPEDWTERLKTEIEKSLQDQSAVDLLWAWNGLVKDGCAKVSQDMTLVAEAEIAGSSRELKDGLKATMQRLAKAQSAGDLTPGSAPKYLLTILTQLLVDQLEHPTGIASISTHGGWLSGSPSGGVPADFAGKMNSFLLTADNSSDSWPYIPGTVFKIREPAKFSVTFGKDLKELLAVCFRKNATSPKWPDWQRDARPVLIELSPICDLAQGHRVSSLLVAGVVVPASYDELVKKDGDAFGRIGKFHLRWPVEGLPEQDVFLAYCHRYKTTLPAEQLADWLEPWFRLRDLPVAAIRNLNAAHAARVGFASLD